MVDTSRRVRTRNVYLEMEGRTRKGDEVHLYSLAVTLATICRTRWVCRRLFVWRLVQTGMHSNNGLHVVVFSLAFIVVSAAGEASASRCLRKDSQPTHHEPI